MPNDTPPPHAPNVTPDMIDGIESLLRDPAQPELHAAMLDRTRVRRVLVELCRRFRLPASGSMDTLRERLRIAARALDRDAITRAAFYGVNGYDAVDAHVNAVLGYAMGGAWHTATSTDLDAARRVIDATDDATLRLLVPGGAFSTPSDTLLPLFALGGRQYAEVSVGGAIVYRTQTSPFRFYCEAAAWIASPALREIRQRFQPTPANE
ncbi:hypothetical protein EKD04_025785 [Chloroflexales bacterium ZM16-3]|nr:hypothetical protein [Chloroflexales bacterium ZM16-3]